MENTFGVNIIPENDIDRIRVLKRYQILGTPSEDAFNTVAQLASKIFNVPIALVSFVDEEEVFFKANVGLGKMRSTPRGQSLCSLAILQSEVTVFENAPTEPCLFANPFVAGKFGLKFYAGAPLITHDGFSIGTLCIIDRKVRVFSEPEREILAGLAKIVMDEIELRLSAIKEIENQKVINSQLIGAQDMLNLALEAAEFGIWKADLKTNQLLASEQTRRLHGLPPRKELMLEDTIQVIDEKFREGLVDSIKKAVKQKINFLESYRINHLNGRSSWIQSAGKAYYDSNNDPLYLTGVILDVTEQKLEEIRKDDFIGMVSHELKTPLTSLKALIQILDKKSHLRKDEFAIDAFAKLNKQVAKMTMLINGFLNVSRLESGKIQIDKQRFNFTEMVKDVISEMKTMYPAHSIILKSSADLFVVADRGKIESVVSNLLDNAAKYSKQGSEIDVKISNLSGDIQFSVRDQGIGIDPNHQQKLFDRYFRVDDIRTKNISGFGIGLYLSAEIVITHGGKIWLISEFEKGSTFFFSLPKNNS